MCIIKEILNTVMLMLMLMLMYAHFLNEAANFTMHRSSSSQMFFRLAVPKYLAVFTGKHLCWSLILKRHSNTGVFT